MQPSPGPAHHDSRESVARELEAALQSGKLNRPAEAVAHYQQALERSRLDPAAYADVVKHLSRSAQKYPRDAAYRHLLGAAHFFGRDLRNAEIHLRKAAELAPGNASILRMLGDCLMQAGKPDGALSSYRNAVKLAPGDRDARLRLAGLLAYIGAREEARGLYQRLIDDGARDPLAYSGLIEVSDYSEATAEPPEYSAAISLAENPALPPALRRMLHFSAAKIDRARKRRDLEFAHYFRAKQFFPYRFDVEYFSDLVAALKEATSPEFFSERTALSDNSQRPVFIFGMPRSGTTLTEQILAAHPGVAAGGELTFFTEAAKSLGIAPRRSEGSLPLERIAERLRSIDIADTKLLAAKYGEQLQQRGPGRMRVTDKMPGNFLHLWLIALVFRDAGYIHCTRDPLATCFSCFTTDLGDAHAYTQDFVTLARYYRIYQDLMRHWIKVLPVRIFESPYEALVTQPESAVRGLLAAVRLDWDPACLTFHESHRLAQTASYAAVREPIHPRKLENWRGYESEIAALRSALELQGDETGNPARPA